MMARRKESFPTEKNIYKGSIIIYKAGVAIQAILTRNFVLCFFAQVSFTSAS
jgi:hypothetical protein